MGYGDILRLRCFSRVKEIFRKSKKAGKKWVDL